MKHHIAYHGSTATDNNATILAKNDKTVSNYDRVLLHSANMVNLRRSGQRCASRYTII